MANNGTYKCEYCQIIFDGRGHYLIRGGFCCDGCNIAIVVPARMRGVHL